MGIRWGVRGVCAPAGIGFAQKSVFNGPPPTISVYDCVEAEEKAVGEWIAGLCGDGLAPHEFGVWGAKMSSVSGTVDATIR